MNKTVLIIGGVIIAAVLLLPLVLGGGAGLTGHVEGERRYDDLDNRWRNHQVPEYAERMGLEQVSRAFFEGRPMGRAGTYDEIMMYFGHTGTRIADPADLPPTTWSDMHNYWAGRVESPEHDLYIWVNEYDCPMVIIFEGGRSVHSTAGMHPDGIRAL